MRNSKRERFSLGNEGAEKEGGGRKTVRVRGRTWL